MKVTIVNHSGERMRLDCAVIEFIVNKQTIVVNDDGIYNVTYTPMEIK